MLESSRLVCFAASARPEEARHFYERTLGLQFVEETPFALVFQANGTTLRIQKVREACPPPYTVLGWNVDNIQATLAELRIKGVRFERYEPLPQDDLGVWTTPEGARVAWFKDPDGNVLSITQEALHRA